MSDLRVDTFSSGREGSVRVSSGERACVASFGPDMALKSETAARSAALKSLFPVCVKHQIAAGECSHCAEDEKILEERIEAVVTAAMDMSFAVRERDERGQQTSSDQLRDALRSLVREVRR